MISCREYALKIISIKDRTRKEVTDKLKEKNYDGIEIEETVGFLAEYGYVNDRRYAEHFTNDAINIKKWGRMRVRTELLRRGIDKDIAETVIEEAFSEADDDMLRTQMEKRFKNADLSNMKERTRIFNFFLRRGFSPEEIKGVMNSLSSFCDIID